MSRASDLRDSIAETLTALLPSERVDSFLLPDYDRDELKDGPRIGVRVGGRSVFVNELGGPDTRTVTIEIGVIGSVPTTHGDKTKAEIRSSQVELTDGYDDLMESIIALWSPRGALSRQGLSEHRFVSIDQPQAFDARQMYQDGVWVAIVSLEYQDSVDEPSEE